MMPYVFVLNGRERCRAFQLTKDDHTFGQRDDADFVLKDPWISWSHARIVKEAGGFAIEDLGSTNGTYVDCVRVKRKPLKEDDVIFLGRTHLLFVASNRPPSAPPPPAPRDPAKERWSGTDRLAVQPDQFDMRPLFSEERESAGAAAPGEGSVEFRGPFEGFGRIEELEEVGREPDTDGFLPPPPREAPAAAGPPSSAVEIDVADLLDSDGQVVGGALPELTVEESVADWAISSAADQPAASIANPVAEIERLRGLVAARDAEIRRLREELQKLKEQYLDL